MKLRMARASMGQLFCSSCGLEVALNPIGEPELVACVGCGGKTFATLRGIDWAAALTENDKKLLHSLRISTQ